MAEPAPQDPPRKPRKRRPAPLPKLAWHDQPWVLPGILVACVLMAMVVGVAWWKQRGSETPNGANAPLITAPVAEEPLFTTDATQQQIQSNIKSTYQGDYTLLDHNLLAKKGLLPGGLAMKAGANVLVSQWGRVELTGANAAGQTHPPYTHFLIIYHDVPQATCVALARQLQARFLQVWVGHSPPLPNEAERLANANDAQAKCVAAGATARVMALGQ